MSLDREVTWIAARLSKELSHIEKFRSAAIQVEDSILKGKFATALDLLDQVRDDFGESFWGIELRFGLLQLHVGLEAQKDYLTGLRAEFKQGLLSFVAFHVSARNEDRTTAGKYREDTLDRIVHRTSFKLGVQSYLDFRLLKGEPKTRRAWADILRCEQSNGFPDLYETFVSFIRAVAAGYAVPPSVRMTVEQLCSSLATVDERLLAVADEMLAHSDGPRRPIRALQGEELLFAGSPAQAYRVLKRALKETPREVWLLLYSGLALAFGRRRNPHNRAHLGAVELLSSILRRSSDAPDALARLEKIALNFANITVGKALLRIAEQLGDKREAWMPETSSALLYSPTVGPEERWVADWPAVPHVRNFWDVAHGRRELGPAPSGPLLLAEGMYHLRSGRPEAAVVSLDSAMMLMPGDPVGTMASLLLLTALKSSGDDARLVERVSVYGTASTANRRLLSTSGLLGGLGWDRFKRAGISIRTCNALHLLWDETADEKVASWLRYATSQVLKAEGRPSEIAEAQRTDDITSAELTYFLRHVCVPGVIDVSRLFQSSREVLEERRAVLAALQDLDVESRAEYQQETLALSNRLTLDEGLTIVDASRIYVDGDAYRQWSRTNLEEAFQRYQDLISAGLGDGADFDEVIRLLATDLQAAKAFFFTPDNQADALLLEMLHKLREAFLTNTTFGFDYYLSKRIRHQSFVGLIRGPLEFASLITTRETERSDYKPNEVVLAELAGLTDVEGDRVNARLATFSQKFDETLSSLRDARLQVRSDEKPEGIFEIPLTPQVLVIARAIAQSDADVAAFTETSLAVFWGAIEASLVEARRIIGEETKNRLVSLIDQLRIDLRAIAGSHPALVGIDTRLGVASAEVQRNLDSAAGWFVRTSNRSATRTFTLEEAVEIAIESAMKSQRAFESEIEREVVGQLVVPAADLSPVTEVIFVALDNVRRHSGLRRPAKIDIRCEANIEGEFLDMEVTSDAAPSARGKEEQRRLDEIADLIEGGTLDKRTRKEGGTGFIKLAAMVRQSKKGQIQFGFTNEGRFRLFVRYSIVVVGRA